MAKTIWTTVTFLIGLTREDIGLEPNVSDEEFKTATEEFIKQDFDYNDWNPNDIEMEMI